MVGGAVPGLVVLSFGRMQAGPSHGSKSVGSTVPRLVRQLLAPVSCPG